MWRKASKLVVEVPLNPPLRGDMVELYEHPAARSCPSISVCIPSCLYTVANILQFQRSSE